MADLVTPSLEDNPQNTAGRASSIRNYTASILAALLMLPFISGCGGHSTEPVSGITPSSNEPEVTKNVGKKPEQSSPISNLSVKNPINTSAQQMYENIINDPNIYVPRALRNDLRNVNDDLVELLSKLKNTAYLTKYKQTYLKIGQYAILAFSEHLDVLYRIGMWKGLEGGILRYNLTSGDVGFAIHSFGNLKRSQSNGLLPLTLVNITYTEDPEADVMYNTSAFLEEVAKNDGPVRAHLIQFSDFNGDGKFDRVFEGYSLPFGGEYNALDEIVLAGCKGVSHELYELYQIQDFNTILAKAPDKIEVNTISGTYEFVATKTNHKIEYKPTQESWENAIGKNTSVEQIIGKTSFGYVPQGIAIAEHNGEVYLATSIGRNMGDTMEYSITYIGGADGKVIRVGNDPNFDWAYEQIDNLGESMDVNTLWAH